MTPFTPALRLLAQEILAQSELADLQALLAARPVTFDPLARLDLSLGGPSMDRLSCHNTGRYDVRDRGVLRPLQYCGTYLEKVDQAEDIAWLTREIVHMSGLHL